MARDNDKSMSGPGASSRKTRIETQHQEPGGPAGKVRARVPEKQGLKPPEEIAKFNNAVRPGASSRKTRIETQKDRPENESSDKSGREFQKNKD